MLNTILGRCCPGTFVGAIVEEPTEPEPEPEPEPELNNVFSIASILAKPNPVAMS